MRPGRGRRLVRVGPVSAQVDLRAAACTALALGALLVLAGWGLTLGRFPIPAGDLVRALVGRGDRETAFILLELRLPRILTAAMVGAMLAMSGTIFQGLLRNPLVSPDIVGVNAGATLAAVFWIVHRLPAAGLPAAAFLGALAAAGTIYVLTWRGRIDPMRLILVGIGVGALLNAGTGWLLVRHSIYQVSEAVLWMSGSVYASDWQDVGVLAAGLAVLAPAGAALMGPLRVLQLGELSARGLGMPVERTWLALTAVGCALSGLAVSVAGPVGFVAFAVPHFARMLVGALPSPEFYLFSGALGALLVLAADLFAQHALPVSLPVGVVTAALGGPYFLFLLYRTSVRR